MSQAKETFLAYAADFEKSFVDDQWERVKEHLSDECVYEVRSQLFGCRLSGPSAIVGGFKKSLDGLDRRFDSRVIEVLGELEEQGDELSAAWKVHYTKEGCPPFTLDGHSKIRCSGGKVVYLADSYEASTEAALTAWQRDNGVDLDPSYT